MTLNNETQMQYAREAAEALNKILGDSIRGAAAIEVQKNGTVLAGIKVDPKEGNVSPTVYVDAYMEKNMTPAECAETIAQDIEKMLDTGKVLVNELPDFGNFDAIKELVQPVLASTANPEYLKDKAYKAFEDLAITYRIPVLEQGSVRVTNQMLERWGKTIDELHEAAVANLAKEAKTPKTMLATMIEMMGPEVEDMLPPEGDEKQYVITNTQGTLGAAQILNSHILDEVAAKNGWENVMILPSSIHECLLLRDPGEDMHRSFINMVREVNETQVSPEERLSDNVYIYNTKTKEYRAVDDDFRYREQENDEIEHE